MKLMVASDIHGSSLFCQKMIAAYERETPDKLLLLGDILYHGPRNDLPDEYDPKQVIQMLNKIKSEIICVRGNCDTEVDQMVLDFPLMAEYSLLYINNKVIFATHGHRLNEQTPPPLNENDIFISGHTHIPLYKKVNRITFINPGSVSIPKENSEHQYMIIDENYFIWKELSGTVLNKINI